MSIPAASGGDLSGSQRDLRVGQHLTLSYSASIPDNLRVLKSLKLAPVPLVLTGIGYWNLRLNKGGCNISCRVSVTCLPAC